jgi:hypothetical protein
MIAEKASNAAFDGPLTMRPHFWRVVDDGPRQRHRRVVVDGDKELPQLRGHLPELDRVLPVVARDRRLPDPGIVDQDVDHPETAARLVDDLIDRLVADRYSPRHFWEHVYSWTAPPILDS